MHREADRVVDVSAVREWRVVRRSTAAEDDDESGEGGTDEGRTASGTIDRKGLWYHLRDSPARQGIDPRMAAHSSGCEANASITDVDPGASLRTEQHCTYE
jgi:hypothetical protein